jgi:hypothetical protein
MGSSACVFGSGDVSVKRIPLFMHSASKKQWRSGVATPLGRNRRRMWGGLHQLLRLLLQFVIGYTRQLLDVCSEMHSYEISH